jgi:hypothetical protein
MVAAGASLLPPECLIKGRSGVATSDSCRAVLLIQLRLCRLLAPVPLL